MGIDLIFRIAAIGIMVSVVNQVLEKSGREEYTMLTTLTGLALVLMIVIKEISNLFNAVKTMFQF